MVSTSAFNPGGHFAVGAALGSSLSRGIRTLQNSITENMELDRQEEINRRSALMFGHQLAKAKHDSTALARKELDRANLRKALEDPTLPASERIPTMLRMMQNTDSKSWLGITTQINNTMAAFVNSGQIEMARQLGTKFYGSSWS